MLENITVFGRFKVQLIEDGQIVQEGETTNEVLKAGLGWLISGGSLASLSQIKVGSDGSPTDYTQNSLNDFIAAGDQGTKQSIDGLDEFEIGFSNYFQVGEATGLWAELGATAFGAPLFNRAVLDPPMDKRANMSAFASVIFTISRAANNA